MLSLPSTLPPPENRRGETPQVQRLIRSRGTWKNQLMDQRGSDSERTCNLSKHLSFGVLVLLALVIIAVAHPKLIILFQLLCSLIEGIEGHSARFHAQRIFVLTKLCNTIAGTTTCLGRPMPRSLDS